MIRAADLTWDEVDTRCEEMRITVYPEEPKRKSYHGADVEMARQRGRKPYDRRAYGEIRGIEAKQKAGSRERGARK